MSIGHDPQCSSALGLYASGALPSIPINRLQEPCRLWAFIGGIARKNGFKALAVGGTDNHVHVLLSLPATMPIAKALQLLKGGSSKWMNDSRVSGFAWQEGYGAFSVGISQRANTIAYINSQAEHHHKLGFEEEFVAFLKKHGIEYDPVHVWG